MNKLRGSRCYLCGAMDRAPDSGKAWRRNLREDLRWLGLHWLDPTRKPTKVGKEDDESRLRRRQAKKLGHYADIREEMKQIRHVDLRMVDICDFLIVNLDLEIHACGTYEEIFLANSQKKPVLIHVEQGKAKTPDWLFGTLPDEYFFGSWADLTEFLIGIASGEIEDSHSRWGFFDWMGEDPIRQE